MQGFLRAAVSIAAIFAAINAPAASAAALQDQAAETEADASEAFVQFNEHLQNREFQKALEVATKLEKSAPSQEARAIAVAMRAGALLGLKRNAEAAELFRQSDALAPQLPLVGSMQISLALWFDDIPLGLAALDRMIGRQPDAVRELDPQLVYGLLREAPDAEKTRNEDREIALARLGYGAEYGDSMVASAIEVLVKRGDLAAASELLRYLDEPDRIQGLLIMKNLSAFWPALEAHAGPGLAKAFESNVESSARDYAAHPDDWVKFTNYAEALRLAGKADEAAALQDKLPSTPEAIAKIEEKAGWAMNNIAYALRAAGRLEDADRLFASLNEADIPNGGWRVNMIINRLAMLVEDGRFERALPLLQGAEQSAKVDGSDYAKQLVRTLQYCTFRRTGRNDEAAKVRPEMLKYAEDARAATIDKLVCAGELDAAEKLALEGLSDEDFHTSFVGSLQRQPLINEDPNVWREGWTNLRQRPAISQAFDRLGRDLPARLNPSR